VEVTFSLDANGILSVTATDKVTGAQAKADIKADRGRLTDSDIERMIADAERYREGPRLRYILCSMYVCINVCLCVVCSEDLALARKIHMRNALEEAIYSIKSNLTERNDLIGISELDDFITWQVGRPTIYAYIHA
jgi:molecular chaperone DnaK (HSP70)